jgi:hypothetical protein
VCDTSRRVAVATCIIASRNRKHVVLCRPHLVSFIRLHWALRWRICGWFEGGEQSSIGVLKQTPLLFGHSRWKARSKIVSFVTGVPSLKSFQGGIFRAVKEEEGGCGGYAAVFWVAGRVRADTSLRQ